MWHTKGISKIEEELGTSIRQGLSEKEAKERMQKEGPNELTSKKKESLLVRFLKQFNDFMIIILIIASIISAVVASIEGSGDYMDSIIIIGIVIVNAMMGVLQEAKAEKALEVLKNMTAPTAKVKRDGKVQTIPGIEVVPGDVILLEAGNYVPADARIIKASNLKIEEASLTGETVAVEKQEGIIKEGAIAIGDMYNMVFASTIVVNGHGEAIVTQTGMHTKVGQIANMIMEEEAPQTPIQKKLAEVGKALGIACLSICALIFVIGLFKQISPIEMFMTSVGLAVAAIPEGLPAIVTIVLSIGVTKMAKKNSIIRHLPAVETLGSSSVICSDKTGTLTQNKMTVREVFTIGDTKEELALQFGTMCSDVVAEEKEAGQELVGEATEIAIVRGAIEKGIRKEKLEKETPRVADIPFDSNRKRMSTIHEKEGQYQIVCKGAPDVLLERCSYYQDGEKISGLTPRIKEQIEKQNEEMAENALRVIAVAYKMQRVLPNTIKSEEIENELIFVGLIGMIDPPREGVKEAVATCRKAGIKTVMITGDHVITAKAIAKELGILKSGDKSITGAELEKLSQKELEKNIMGYSVFARVSPEHKVRIVKAFQSTGAVVAMTGDGVNDAPALKNADIGIAMGQNGTDVAKNAADMILVDDNFVTIVGAVKQGRNIYDNIKKAIHFLIATNIGEIVTIFMGLVLGLKTPLLAIQLLWVNLVTDSFPAIALGLEKPEKDIMSKKPRDAKKGIFADGLWSKIFVEGIMLGMLTLFAFSIGNYLFGLEVGRTMAFVSLGMLELIHSFNIKSEETIFKMRIFRKQISIGSLFVRSRFTNRSCRYSTTCTNF